MSSDRFDDNQNLPPWLRDVPMPPRPSQAAPPPPAASASAPGTALPEWLRELNDDSPAPAPETPSQPAPVAPAADELPDWLRDLGGEQPPPEPPAPLEGVPAPPAEPAAPLPDWLRESQPAAPAEPAAPLPDWLRDTSAPAAPLPTGDTAVPDWLREAQESAPPTAETPVDWPAPAASEPAQADSGIPSWLADLSDDDAPAKTPETDLWGDDEPRAPEPPAPEPAELPSWLHDEAPAEPAAAAGSATEDGLAGWLSEPASQPDPTDSLAPFSLDEPGDTSDRAAPPGGSSWIANDIGAAAEDMPSWLNAAAEPSDGGEAPPADVPLWLQDRDQDAAPPTPAHPPEPEAAAPPAAEEAPAWLTPGAPEAPPPDDSVPAWLREAAAVEPPQVAPASGEPDWLTPGPGQGSAPAEEIPAWLREASAAPAAEETPAWLTPGDTPAPAPAAEDVPAWLTPGDTPAPPPAGDDLPAWLRDEAPGTPAAPVFEAPAAAEQLSAAPPADELPTWLRDEAPAASQPAETGATPGDLPPWLRDEAGQPLPMAAAPGDANLPTWLHGASADAPPAPATEGAGIPSWLSETAPSDSQPAATNELVGGVELPPWLRPPEQPKEEINPTDARSLDWLARLGAQDDDEGEVATATPQVRLSPRPAITRTAAQVEAIALLERLAAAPFPTPAPAAEAATPSIWQRIGVERLLYIVLLLAVVAALLAPTPNLLGLADPPAAPGAADLFARIDALTADDIVLVGYEWDARRSGELRPLEQAVVDHLIQHHVKLVLISTDPQGSLLLYDLRDRLGAAGYKPSGEDYILLGYKPGAELALRMIAQNFPGALASDFQGNDASTSLLATTPDRQQRLKTLSDFSMILVLGDEAADVQGWMEQVRPSARQASGGYVPFGFVLPAETAPIVQPYLGQPNVLHLAGKQGALAYQQLRGDAAAPAAQIAAETGQQRFSELLYLALLLIGAIAVGIHSAVTRGRSRT